jgi:hypothetical protein
MILLPPHTQSQFAILNKSTSKTKQNKKKKAQQTANSKQQTANSKQQTANSKKQTANSKQQTANSKQQTANSKQQTRRKSIRLFKHGFVWDVNIKQVNLIVMYGARNEL